MAPRAVSFAAISAVDLGRRLSAPGMSAVAAIVPESKVQGCAFTILVHTTTLEIARVIPEMPCRRCDRARTDSWHSSTDTH